MKELDGGQLDAPKLSRSAAVRQICEGLELENPSVQDAPLSMICLLYTSAVDMAIVIASFVTVFVLPSGFNKASSPDGAP